MEKTSKSLGLYFGKFEPLHVGHLHIRSKALQMFDVVKLVKLYSPSLRSDVPSKYIDIVYSLDPINLISQFEKRYDKVVMIRAIRNEKDFTLESIYYDQLKLQKSNLAISYIFPDQSYRNITSGWINTLPETERIKYTI